MEKTDYLLREWISIYHAQPSARDSTKAFSMFVHQMNVQGILKTDDLITRFFRLSTQLCVETVYRNLQDQNLSQTVIRAKCYHTLDAFVRLVALLVKHSGDSSNTTTKIHLLNKVSGQNFKISAVETLSKDCIHFKVYSVFLDNGNFCNSMSEVKSKL